MTQDIKTLELAKIYERQGYFEDAYEIYSFLDEKDTNNEIQTGLRRLKKKITDDKQQIHPGQKISFLFEKWLKLMVLKQRLDNFKKIKSRLS